MPGIPPIEEAEIGRIQARLGQKCKTLSEKMSKARMARVMTEVVDCLD
jgi:hypothetical protein